MCARVEAVLADPALVVCDDRERVPDRESIDERKDGDIVQSEIGRGTYASVMKIAAMRKKRG